MFCRLIKKFALKHAAAFTFPLISRIRAMAQDVYAMAIDQLQQKVGSSITQDEFARFCVASVPCSQMTAKAALNDASAGQDNNHPTLKKFVHLVDRLFEPLERFKSALDTFVQVAKPASLIWGSLKIIITVSHLPGVCQWGNCF